MSAFPWIDLPCEIKYEIIDVLEVRDIRRLSMVSKDTYDLCVPELFQVRVALLAFQRYILTEFADGKACIS